MRYLAIDIGEKRCGIAISDARERIATPVDVVPLADVVNRTGRFAEILDEYEPDEIACIVCGLPVSLSGEEGSQAHRIRTIAGQIAKATGLPVRFTDERLSSAQAKDALRDMGYDDRGMKGKVDMIAASIFLQSWLDSRNRSDQVETPDQI